MILKKILQILRELLLFMEDKDINIKVDKGVVFIDISDKLLFKSGSYVVTDQAKEVLGKVAKVITSFVLSVCLSLFFFTGFSFCRSTGCVI